MRSSDKIWPKILKFHFISFIYLFVSSQPLSRENQRVHTNERKKHEVKRSALQTLVGLAK